MESFQFQRKLLLIVLLTVSVFAEIQCSSVYRDLDSQNKESLNEIDSNSIDIDIDKVEEIHSSNSNIESLTDKAKTTNQQNLKHYHNHEDFSPEKLQVALYQPRHVHIAYSENPSEMVITWSTVNNPNESIVEYGLENVGEMRESRGTITQFTESGVMKLKQFIHRVTLRNLTQGQKYVYHCGSDSYGWSDIFFFTAMKNEDQDENWTPHFAVYGDLGVENAKSLTRLQKEVQEGEYDAVLHVGDFAYNMETSDGLIGDAFMDEIQPIAAYVPYMTCPGNHESADNFTQYKNRFSMPGNYESMFYSWNMGSIHFISISTEFYFYLQYGLKPVFNQYAWLENDLKEATKPENRKKRPWIIIYGHRPMYCTNNNEECIDNESILRIGLPLFHILGLEEILHRYGVDLAIFAHEHSFERLYPLYNRKVYNGSLEEPFRNPKALTQVITGSAGCWSRHDDFPDDKPPWSAFRTVDYGYSRMKVLNSSHLYYEQISIDKGGEIIDSFFLVRDHHNPYGPF